MKKRYLIIFFAMTLAALTPIACGSGSGNVKSSDIVYVTKAPHQTAGSNQDGNSATTGVPVTAGAQTASGETPAPETARTPLPTATPVASPVPGKRLPDGEYRVMLYSDLTVDQSGCVWATIGEQKYQELPDSIISTTEVGDVLTLRSYSFEVVDMDRTEKNDVPMIRFNDGTECCLYIEETDTWRFVWPDGSPYTYEAERYLMPLAVDASLTDEMTPHAEGRNVYGEAAGSNDPTIGILDDLQDFFRHYRGLDGEYALITVYGGEITSVIFAYHQ